jgi:hypothetical protein
MLDDPSADDETKAKLKVHFERLRENHRRFLEEINGPMEFFSQW